MKKGLFAAVLPMLLLLLLLVDRGSPVTNYGW
jgi:hypothetical protein